MVYKGLLVLKAGGRVRPLGTQLGPTKDKDKEACSFIKYHLIYYFYV